MILSPKSLEKLRLLINEETEYRSGPQLVRFFNALGFSDAYGQGFPSRWMYTDERLALINGSPEIDKCIKSVLNPANFIDKFSELDQHIDSFNKFLAFDKWKVVRQGADITFKKLDKVEVEEPVNPKGVETEDQFLKREFSDISIVKIGLDGYISEVLGQRIKEIEKCFSAGAYLSVILIAGSTLEGILLGLATQYPRHFNSANSSPKDGAGKVQQFHDWTLSAFIDVAYELKLVQHDIQRFSHTLRDFRNYIHPFQQMSSGFNPREHTAKICLQVLKAAIYEVSENIPRLRAS
ncbi:TPA: hypothetical protein ACKP97_003930 [Pseudomonas aeruginosa]|uniref:hypothetical protein n=1 Tax=Pseudomonas aeruginosa TaxID=287 RepID=UPI00071B848C|nr:hypothetical protein [Pseudomonas aeruginosa]AZZ10886.1 hypothetical protein CEK59_04215 [Pseudomonas aeruginosa]EKN9356163.1 hypothetical protein [Pseudomonas aeruginosa]KSJ39154.1 hypothetical protein APA00_16045 [Pseudomonas aeruginosa]MBG5166834.1 hypothetical protein [Pseudomonas aeruginosa]MBS9747745.1 hypothetical protein [Pseudomonas aeruginosa]